MVSFLSSELNRPSKWDAPGGKTHRYEYKAGAFTFADAYVDVPHACNEPLVAIFWEPENAPTRTAFMVNHEDGMSFAIEKLSKKSPAEWVQVRIADADQLEFPATQFRYFKESTRRQVANVRDEDGWQFIQDGPPLPFEQVSEYAKVDESTRLTRSTIASYLRHLGYSIDTDEFWRSRTFIRLSQNRAISKG